METKISRGFSLLEIVIAMLILSLVVVGMFGLFVQSHKYITEASHRLQAINYARQVAETLKVYVSADPDNPANAGTILADVVHEHPHTELGIPDIATVMTDVTNPDCDYAVSNDPQSATGLKAVTITVSWTEP